jgi:fructokinase
MRPFLIVGESILDVIEASGTRRELPGGSPANVAVGLGRLGHDTALWTHLGDDPAGALLRDHLTGSGVSLPAPIAGVTSQAIARIQPDGSARYDFAVEWPRWPSGPAAAEIAAHLHTGSIAALLSPGAGDIGNLLRERRATTTISYDPNIRPSLTGPVDTCRTRVESLVAVSDVVKASDEDLAWLYPDVAPVDVARRWQASGPALVAVTLGWQGAFAVTENDHVTVPPVPVTVADTVGAGDSFMAGLLDALWTRRLLGSGCRARLRAITAGDVHQVLSHAALVAAITVSRIGATPPTREELPV